jgi:hypothetical protein
VKAELSPYGRILIRPFWEFNYTGSEWNDVHYGGDAPTFVSAWRYDAPGTFPGDNGSQALAAAKNFASNCYMNVLSGACKKRPTSTAPSSAAASSQQPAAGAAKGRPQGAAAAPSQRLAFLGYRGDHQRRPAGDCGRTAGLPQIPEEVSRPQPQGRHPRPPRRRRMGKAPGSPDRVSLGWPPCHSLGALPVPGGRLSCASQRSPPPPWPWLAARGVPQQPPRGGTAPRSCPDHPRRRR